MANEATVRADQNPRPPQKTGKGGATASEPLPGPVPVSSSGQGRGESDFPFAVSVAEVYEGPLDLLLDLIRKQDIDIYDIPIARLTAQFLAYVERIKQMDVDIAAEFIYMASMLIHIKSKMLLPRDPDAPPGEQEDPREELVNRLLTRKVQERRADAL